MFPLSDVPARPLEQFRILEASQETPRFSGAGNGNCQPLSVRI